MKKFLKSIASIQTGFFGRPMEEGDVVYLQVKHFDEDGILKSDLHGDIPLEKIPSKHLLQNGDILFASKGAKNFAAVFENHFPPSVASTSFFVFKLTTMDVLPNYLAWYLNHPSTLTSIKSFARGTSTPSISKEALENLEITIPSQDVQKVILAVTKLYKKEKSLRQKIEALREKQIQQQIINAIK